VGLSLKILQVNNFHYPRGGADRYFLSLTGLLRNAGHDVRTFSTANPENINEEWLVVEPPAGIDTEITGSVKDALRFLFSQNTRSRMMEAIGRFRPDIAHLHIYYGQLTASIVAPLRCAGIPIVQTLHEYKLVCPTHGLYANGSFCDACQGRHYWRAVTKRCNRGSLARSALSTVEAYVSDALGAKDAVAQFIAVSEFQRDQLIRLGAPPERINILRHFATPCDPAPDLPGEYILYVGRIHHDKGIKVLLDAMARLGEVAPPLKIVGAGSEARRWQSYADTLGLTDRVNWLGFCAEQELSGLYRGSLVVVNPSMLNETFGLTCLEALAHGRPVIASRVGALPEVVDDMRDGILVRAGSTEDLADGILRMAGDPTCAHEMGLRGREKVGREFSRSRHYDDLMEIYGKVTNA
jgi:glycosyltransferase involved in cell wall biosynthesis